MALVAGRFAAPTSAGILFTMLEAAGMKETWLFQKARILAIFDDLDTLILMVPLKAFVVGAQWELSIDLVWVFGLLVIMYKFLHRVDIPATRLARGNHLGGLAFFWQQWTHHSGSAAVAAGQLNPPTPKGSAQGVDQRDCIITKP